MAVYIAFTIIGWCMVILAFFLNLHWHKKDLNAKIRKLNMQIDAIQSALSGIKTPSERFLVENKKFAKAVYETVNSAKDMRTAIELLEHERQKG